MALTSGVPSWEVLPKAKTATLKAVELDEALAEAHAALGFIIFWFDWDWLAAEKQFRRALELDPNSAEAHFGYAHLLSNTGRHEQALAEIKLSREIDPVSLGTNALEGQILSIAGKHDEALDRLQKTIDLNPNFWLSHLFISDVYTEKRMYSEALVSAEKAGEISGNSQSKAYRAYALARWGKFEEARAVLDELLRLANARYVSPYNLAVVYSGLGEREKALDCLEKAFEEREPKMTFLKVEPKWNNLRGEPRFSALMKRMNFE
jgi:tetratricopeptide (TPR) repeat protein